MKAAVCYEFDCPLVVEEIEIDSPQAGEVKVRLSACAICHSDIHAIDGDWGGSLPVVYGHEAAGVVDSVGPGVTHAGAGDHVVVTLIRSCGHCFYCAQGSSHHCETEFALGKEHRLHTKAGQAIHQGIRTGAFAEFVVVDESQIVRIPPEIPLDSASLLACGVITGLGAVVNTAKVPSGSSVAVIGTGGVGLNSIQGARLSGAQPIVAIDLSDQKLEAAKAFGATHTINSSSEDARDVIRSLTSGRGADYVFVTVGNAKVIGTAVDLLRPAGTLVLVGMPASGEKAEIEVVDMADHAWRLLGSKMGSTRLRVDIPKLVELYAQGRLMLDELISARYPLDHINEAIASVKRGEALRNVIVF